jgi:UDP-N-acetylglucosamine diphosphorylase/glucosamine-1-phosphate N-acetyltransferase
MECVVLAAGEGTRMRPLTSTRPKVMLPIANKPMLEHLMIAARDAGIHRFVFVVGYRENEIRAYFKDGSAWGVTIRYATQRAQRGTADALNAAQGLVKGSFLMMNGDMLLKSADIEALMQKESPCIGIYPYERPQNFGVVTIDGERVTGLVEKSPAPPSNLINAGIYSFDQDIFRQVAALSVSERGEFELTDALLPYIRSGQLRFHRLDYWYDVGEPWDLLDANEAMIAAISHEIKGEIEEGVTISGPFSLGEGSVVRAGTYIQGPCVIGSGCTIGPHAFLRGVTTIGDGCHIGHCTEVKNSVIFPNTKIPHFNYIGDSVVGSGCNMGAGTKVANLRHDRQNVRISGRDTGRKKFGAVIGDHVQFGINCSVNVGTIIGSDVAIAPHSYVEGSVANKTVIGR